MRDVVYRYNTHNYIIPWGHLYLIILQEFGVIKYLNS